MEWTASELLFYGGIAGAAGSLLLGIVCLCVVQIRLVRLKARLDEEYGREER